MKIPRNAPCPCGSRKKYKKCCAGVQQLKQRPPYMSWEGLSSPKGSSCFLCGREEAEEKIIRVFWRILEKTVYVPLCLEHVGAQHVQELHEICKNRWDHNPRLPQVDLGNGDIECVVSFRFLEEQDGIYDSYLFLAHDPFVGYLYHENKTSKREMEKEFSEWFLSGEVKKFRPKRVLRSLFVEGSHNLDPYLEQGFEILRTNEFHHFLCKKEERDPNLGTYPITQEMIVLKGFYWSVFPGEEFLTREQEMENWPYAEEVPIPNACLPFKKGSQLFVGYFWDAGVYYDPDKDNQVLQQLSEILGGLPEYASLFASFPDPLTKYLLDIKGQQGLTT